MNEHEIEPVPGLPEALPQGESMLWQGAPRARSLAIHAFHFRLLAIYFGGLLIWTSAGAIEPGASLDMVGMSLLRIVGFAGLVLGLVAGFAYLVERTTIYSITTRRIVLRFGVALPMSINIPFGQIEEAALKKHADGSGDIAFTLSGKQRIAYLLLWPHARPWQVSRSIPALRAVPNAAGVAEILGNALAGSTAASPDYAPARARERAPASGGAFGAAAAA